MIMPNLPRQLRLLGRRLLREPLFTITTVITLALGIGANIAIFSVIDGVLLAPLPYDDPDSLVGVWHEAPGLDFEVVNQSPALHFTYREKAESFEDVALYNPTSLSVTGAGEPEQLRGMLVTEGLFNVLGIGARLGRLFDAEDDTPQSPETVVLSHAYWQRRFGGATDVVGRTLRVDGREREIIGVLPPSFRLLDFEAEIYLPARFDRSRLFVGNFSYRGLARLRPGVSIEQANAEIDNLLPVATELFPGGITKDVLEEARFAAALHPLKEDLVGDIGRVLWVLLGTVGFVLLIACANVANLFLVRSEGRSREVALRRALGAGRRDVAGQFLLESLVLGLAGGALGVGLAAMALRLLVRIGPEGLPRLDQIGINGSVLAFALCVSILAGLFFGLFPVFRYRRSSLVEGLREGSRGSGTGHKRHRLRSALVVSQVALALVLLIGSGLMLRSFAALRAVEPGFERPEEVLTFVVSVPEAEVEDPLETAQVFERIRSEVESLPGVASVGLTTSVTMDGRQSMDPIFFEDFPLQDGQLPTLRIFKYVGEGYFATMENPLRAGRTIDRSDLDGRRPVAVISENLAREVYGEPAAAIGRRIRTLGPSEGEAGFDIGGGGPWREIVGVVGDVRDKGVNQDPPTVVFWPMVMEQFYDQEIFVPRSLSYVVRASGLSPSSLVPQVRQAVWSVNSSLPLANVRTLDEILQGSLARTSFTLVMLAIAAAVALLLGTVGIYGVLSYIISQRAHEIGIRMALGAGRATVSRMVLRNGLVLALFGVAIGLPAAAGLTRLMATLLFGVAATDPLTYASVSVLLALVALAASLLAARRATGVDPIEALRIE